MAHTLRLHCTPHRSVCNSLFAYTVKNMRWIDSYHIASSSVFGRSGDVSNGFLSFLNERNLHSIFPLASCTRNSHTPAITLIIIVFRRSIQIASLFHYLFYYKITARIRIPEYVSTDGFSNLIDRSKWLVRERSKWIVHVQRILTD